MRAGAARRGAEESPISSLWSIYCVLLTLVSAQGPPGWERSLEKAPSQAGGSPVVPGVSLHGPEGQSGR